MLKRFLQLLIINSFMSIFTLLILFSSLPAKSKYIELKDYLPHQKVELIGWKAQLGRIPNAEKINFDDSLWENADALFRWQGNNTDCWFRKEVKVPDIMDGKAVYFQVTIDNGGEVFINEKSKGKFGWTSTILLTPKAKAGEKFFIAMHGTSDTVFGILIETSLTTTSTEICQLQQKVEQLSGLKKKSIMSLNDKWRFILDDRPEYKEVHADDRDWDVVNATHTWRKENTSAWYRKTITLPDTINGFKIDEASITIDFGIDDNCEVFINGKKIGYYKNSGKCTLTEVARAGEAYTIAFRVINNRGRGRLKYVSLRFDDFTEKLQLVIKNLTEAIQLIERFPEPLESKIKIANKITDTAIKAANASSITMFLDLFELSNKELTKLDKFFAEYPLQIKGPYLQNVNKNAITVMWETNVPSDSRVYFGTTATYDKSNHKEEKVKIHRVRLTGLQPEQLYHYRIQSGKAACADNTFRTGVHVKTPFKFSVYGDSRTDPVAHERVINAMIEKKSDFVINVGDVVGTGQYEEWGREHFYPIRNLSKNTTMFIAIGNHEYNVATLDRRVIWFENLVDQPLNKYWYSINYGNSHFIFLDTAKEYPTDIPPESEQYKWLIQDLQSDSCKNATWRFVFFHHPIYSEGWSGGYYDGEIKLQEHLVPLFEENDITMIFQGHTHDYEFGRWPKDTGPCYIITGGGGASLDDIKYREWKQIDKIEFKYHFCAIEINGGKLKFKAIDTLGNVFDQYELTK
jgi:hypothetical protein